MEQKEVRVAVKVQSGVPVRMKLSAYLYQYPSCDTVPQYFKVLPLRANNDGNHTITWNPYISYRCI